MSGFTDEVFVSAGEYVLGSLDAIERFEAEARRARDPEFADAVTFWENRFAPLCGLVEPVTPPTALWSRLALATGVRTAPVSRAPGAPRFWQATTAVACLVAAGLAAVAFLPILRNQDGPGPLLAAAIGPLNAPTPFLAEVSADGHVSVTNVSGTSAPPGRSFQLWALPAGASTPVSLGVLGAGQANILRGAVLPGASSAAAQTKLLVSDEPSGGSPTGLPTGAVLFGGTVTPVEAPGR